MRERRKETRYGVPKIYREYVTFKIRKESVEFLPVELLDFSLYGIKIKNSFLLSVDSTIECLIAIPKSLTKEISFSGRIKYCIQDKPGEDYLIGIEINQTSDKLWLDLFSKVHDFIKERMGDIF